MDCSSCCPDCYCKNFFKVGPGGRHNKVQKESEVSDDVAHRAERAQTGFGFDGRDLVWPSRNGTVVGGWLERVSTILHITLRCIPHSTSFLLAAGGDAVRRKSEPQESSAKMLATLRFAALAKESAALRQVTQPLTSRSFPCKIDASTVHSQAAFQRYSVNKLLCLANCSSVAAASMVFQS